MWTIHFKILIHSEQEPDRQVQYYTEISITTLFFLFFFLHFFSLKSLKLYWFSLTLFRGIDITCFKNTWDPWQTIAFTQVRFPYLKAEHLAPFHYGFWINYSSFSEHVIFSRQGKNSNTTYVRISGFKNIFFSFISPSL